MKTNSLLFPTWTSCGLALAVVGLPGTTAASNFTDANWSSLGGFPGADGEVHSAVIDASGNLYIGGDFTVVGDVIAHGIARWDGINWSPLRTEIDTSVYALAVIGSDLYAAGYIVATDGIATSIAKWDGSNWSALGSGIGGPDPTNPGYVSALAVSGSDLYVGGTFTKAGGIAALNVAKWNGSTWSALGSGLGDGVSALAVSRGNLYAIIFTTEGDNGLAKWDGNSWSALPLGLRNSAGGVSRRVEALAVSGSDLYVAGAFTNVAGVAAHSIAKWNGSSWSAVGAGFFPTGAWGAVATALAVSGHDLYAAGTFRSPTQIGLVAKWDGTNWSTLGSLGIGRSGSEYYFSRMNALAVSGTNLYAGGVFGAMGGDNIAKWDGNNWSAVRSGSGLNSDVYSLTAVGSDLYVAGNFSMAGGVAARNIAKWNGIGWSALGELGSGYYGMAVLAVSGSDLYAGGYFNTTDGNTTNGIAKWNGSSWSVLGTGFGTGDFAPQAWALAASGKDVYAGGVFTTAGGVAARNIAKWDGSSWSALGSGLNSPVHSLAVAVSDLYAGGEFTKAGGSAATNIAKWNGSSWTALGSGINGYVFALTVSGSDVYAGGSFTMAGGLSANNIAKWNGNSWSALGTGVGRSDSVTPVVTALLVLGSDVYVGGSFTTAGGRQANNIAKWNGSSWSALGLGLSGDVGIYDAPYVSALAVSGSDLYAGGYFTKAGGKVSPFIARAYLPDLPALSVRRSGGDLMVSWASADTSGFALEEAGALSSPTSWVANAAIITDDGVEKSATVPATDDPQFFRLRRP